MVIISYLIGNLDLHNREAKIVAQYLSVNKSSAGNLTRFGLATSYGDINLVCHWLNKYQFLISEVLCHWCESSFTVAILYNGSENFTHKINVICPRSRWVIYKVQAVPDSKVHGANMRPTWGRQDPGGPHVGHVNLVIWGSSPSSGKNLIQNTGITSVYAKRFTVGCSELFLFCCKPPKAYFRWQLFHWGNGKNRGLIHILKY